ncbi:hypothetical protein [Candidatus Borrarchaeum sp.]|uniref:hypothetical protein n=1 Tax=Candidatus Borrarchaeum sp. TaxID=2846742 RepID=UPI00258040D2|nr:hypothetical protein [Candidatus Borrarchaeum sp.]
MPLNSTNSDKVKMERAFLARTVKLITDLDWDAVDWVMALEMFMFGDLLDNTPRLRRSQYFKDPDYPEIVYRVFKHAYEENPPRTISMALHVIQNDIKPDNEVLERYPLIKAYLENKVADVSQIFPEIGVPVKYLDIEVFPDSFYGDLTDFINKCYMYELYPAVVVFSRKLLENLLVDVLRKKYGRHDVELFFDINHNRFHIFNILLKNFKDHINDFKPIIPHLDHNFIDKINIFRESGNSAAHTLEVHLSKGEIDNNKDELEFVVKTLIRLYNNL